MKTTTDDIILSPGIDEAILSPECTSRLIDLWSDLRTSSVEAVQTPFPNLFAFAESCLFFAVILQNEVVKKSDVVLDEIDEEEIQRGLWLSRQEAHSLNIGGGGSSSREPANGGHDNQWEDFDSSSFKQNTTPIPNLSPFIPEEIEREYKSEKLPSHLLHDNSGNDIFSMDESDENPSRLRQKWLDEAEEETWTDSMDHNTVHGDPVRYPSMQNALLPSSYQFPAPSHNQPQEKDFSTSNFPVAAPRFSSPALSNIPSVPYDYARDQFFMTAPQKKAIGIVYLTSSPQENVPSGEANIGIILTPEAQGKGFAKQATELVLTWVFDEIGLHRVQAAILETPAKARTILLFTQMGFVHEGVRRRSVYCDTEGVRGAWKDVTYLALLETEWLMRSYLKPAPKSLWDEMFARHSKEREELLRWDDGQRGLTRTSSMETVRVLDSTSEEASTADEDEYFESSLAPSSSVPQGKKRKFGISPSPAPSGSHASSPPPSDSEYSTTSWDTDGWDSDGPESRLPNTPFSLVPRGSIRDSDAFSVSSTGSSSLGRISSPTTNPRNSSSPTGSGWDMLETSSVSSSNFESVQDSDEDL